MRSAWTVSSPFSVETNQSLLFSCFSSVAGAGLPNSLARHNRNFSKSIPLDTSGFSPEHPSAYCYAESEQGQLNSSTDYILIYRNFVSPGCLGLYVPLTRPSKPPATGMTSNSQALKTPAIPAISGIRVGLLGSVGPTAPMMSSSLPLGTRKVPPSRNYKPGSGR